MTILRRTRLFAIIRALPWIRAIRIATHSNDKAHRDNVSHRGENPRANQNAILAGFLTGHWLDLPWGLSFRS